MARYLGIDYGKKKIGLAISEGLVATPFKTLDISSLEDALFKVKSVVKKEGIERVIVGVPESGEAAKITKAFIDKLCKEVMVVEVEETLSTRRAQDLMISLGKGRKDRSKEDSYAATFILQEYLDEEEK